MLLQINERKIEPGIVHVEVMGSLTIERDPQRLEVLTSELAEQGASKVILDLTGVVHIDSSGIGVIVVSSGRFKEAGSRFVVVVPEGRVLQLLKRAGLDGLLTISDTVQAAAAAVA